MCVCVMSLLFDSARSVQGVTGFGSAILNLCTWIVFKVAGMDSGEAQHAG